MNCGHTDDVYRCSICGGCFVHDHKLIYSPNGKPRKYFVASHSFVNQGWNLYPAGEDEWIWEGTKRRCRRLAVPLQGE